jgi:hypothetical protein
MHFSIVPICRRTAERKKTTERLEKDIDELAKELIC